jgi:uncharacterized protein (TIGR01244 family)
LIRNRRREKEVTNPVQATDKLKISAQPEPSEFDRFAADGVTLLINNRPDGEDSSQPGDSAERSAATAAGLNYLHLPVTGPTITEGDIRAFQRAVTNSKGAVLAHCKSGTRSFTLWVLGEVLDGRIPADEIELRATQLGFDPKPASAWLSKQAS